VRLAEDDTERHLSLYAAASMREKKMKIFLIAACMAFCLPLPCRAHDSNHPEFNQWYKQLRNPSIHSEVVNCCSVRDCHGTEAEIRGNQWWARVGRLRLENALVGTVIWTLTEWRPVPDYAVGARPAFGARSREEMEMQTNIKIAAAGRRRLSRLRFATDGA
jgi:hypothetical protein